MTNSPSNFCRFVRHIFKKLIAEGIVTTYMDDIIIIANNETEALERLKIVLELAASYNLKIKWKKCKFLKRKVIFLGSEIENQTIVGRMEKTKNVRKYQI